MGVPSAGKAEDPGTHLDQDGIVAGEDKLLKADRIGEGLVGGAADVLRTSAADDAALVADHPVLQDLGSVLEPLDVATAKQPRGEFARGEVRLVGVLLEHQ
jgi:hypothetical protein